MSSVLLTKLYLAKESNIKELDLEVNIELLICSRKIIYSFKTRVLSPQCNPPYFRKFVIVCSFVGWYNMFIENSFKFWFSLMSRTTKHFHVNIISDFTNTCRNASVLYQSECACLHKTVNMVAVFVKSNENTYPKGKALMQVYIVVPITKRGI